MSSSILSQQVILTNMKINGNDSDTQFFFSLPRFACCLIKEVVILKADGALQRGQIDPCKTILMFPRTLSLPL